MKWPFGILRPLSYGVILADPPWRFELHSDEGDRKSPQAHYACMETAAIAALPAGHLGAGDAVLALWATWPMLPDALRVMEAWGYQYKTGLAWAKQSKRGNAWAFGTGYILRSASELLLLGTTGAPTVRARDVRNLVVAPVREHSRKPDAVHGLLERLFNGPYCELFGRQRRAGWDVWGNQADRFEAAE